MHRRNSTMRCRGLDDRADARARTPAISGLSHDPHRPRRPGRRRPDALDRPTCSPTDPTRAGMFYIGVQDVDGTADKIKAARRHRAHGADGHSRRRPLRASSPTRRACPVLYHARRQPGGFAGVPGQHAPGHAGVERAGQQRPQGRARFLRRACSAGKTKRPCRWARWAITPSSITPASGSAR